MKELVCIVCPRGCQLKVDDNLNVTGNFCPRGVDYAKKELTNPERIITTFVNVSNRKNMVLSVKVDKAVPKDKIFDVIKEIKNIEVSAPIEIGHIIKENILNLGLNLVATKKII